jgi:arylsulfatase A-like enzyme
MTRRSARLALAACLLGACGARDSSARERPHVILVSIDTLRADHTGLHGYERDTTPFLDRWSAGATVYERAFAPCAWTLISHMTMLTGLFPSQHGVVKDELALAPEIPLLAERLRAAGYATVGLYHPSWVHERHGFARGFDVFRAHDDVAEAGAHLGEELGRLDPERPLFLFVHLYDVHNRTLNEGREVLYPAPAPYQDMFLDERCEPLPALPAAEIWDHPERLSAGQLRSLIAYYDGGIRHVDAELETWFGLLERSGWLAGALVIVTSDHGEALGQRGQLDGHGGFAQEGLHVPLVVRHPRGAGSGERVREVVHLGDLVPTVLEVAGLPADPRLPGRSLFGPLPPDRVITGAYSFPPSGYVLRWPLKVLQREGGRVLSVDLERDPLETRLEKASREVYRELLEQAIPPGADFPPARKLEPLSEEERAELRALGYGG